MGNLQQPNGTDCTLPRNRPGDVCPQSGLCSRCVEDCTGNCEVFKAALRGQELVCAGADEEMASPGGRVDPVDYSHLNIHGYAMTPSAGPHAHVAHSAAPPPPVVDTQTAYGWEHKVTMAAPVCTGAIGSTEMARRNWEHFATGAALTGITCVCADNVCAADPDLRRDAHGRIACSPDIDRRIAAYRRYHRGYGELLVQANADDMQLGLAEYLIDKHGLDTLELKWGQTPRSLGGPIQVDSPEAALELQGRGYVVTPDPSSSAGLAAFRDGSIRHFQAHGRLGFVEEDGFHDQCRRLRQLGFKRITLRTGAYGLRELALALKWSSRARIDLLTIDGTPGAAGGGSTSMTHPWGVPAVYLHSAAAEFAARLAARGERVPDLALAGGFSTEEHIFKSLALGAPFVKAASMGRALMIPGVVGKNIARWIQNGQLPTTVSRFGSTPAEIFACWEQVAELVGPAEMSRIPLGAVGIYSYVSKLQAGLRQLMANARCYCLPAISRRDLMSLTRQCADVTGIPYVMDSYREEAEAILAD
ncbi:MAG: glutamate synthase-related protein [Thermoguttaceae bacterium]